jgi:sugar O-acyltransferase (sialic acid O-acetyltransferase NeuD family)
MNILENKVVIVGSGGHASVVEEIFEQLGFKEILIMDQSLEGIALQVDLLLDNRKQFKDTHLFFVAIGNNKDREKVTKLLLNEEFKLTTAIHPSSIIPTTTTIDIASCVMAGAVLNPYVQISKGVIVNTSSSIDHHSNIGSFAHVCPGAVLAGGVVVGERCFVGAGAVISNQVSITSDVTLGAGCVVIESIKESGTYVGVPARKL